MAASMDDTFDEATDDSYYTLLNVSKDATNDEIKSAYHRLCIIYHPDKHNSSGDRKSAETFFAKLHKSYEVLMDPQLRTIYDIYGVKGLEADWQVIERKRTPQEIREEYERLQKEREERRVQQRTNPHGTVTIAVNASDAFDHYDEPGVYHRSNIPSLFVSSVSLTQSIEAPLTTKDNLSMSGAAQTQNGNGRGNFCVSLRRVVNDKCWAEMELGAGEGPSLQLRAYRSLSARMFTTVALGCQSPRTGLVTPALQAVVARHLDRHTMGYLTWKWGAQSAMQATAVRDTNTSHVACSAQLGTPSSFLSASYSYKLPDDARIKFSVKYGVLGVTFEYGGEKRISKNSLLGASVCLGYPSGVTLKLKLNRGNQQYVMPIFLSEEIAPAPLFYGTIAPLAIFAIVGGFLDKVYFRRETEEVAEREREENVRRTAERRRECLAEIRLMRVMVDRIRETEESKQGLIIERAHYGKLVTDGSRQDPGAIIDVAIPLQSLVNDSKLIVHATTTKSSLPGFYDPCPGTEKSLAVSYRFRGAPHQVTVADNEHLKIPKQSHRLPDEPRQ